MGTHSPAKKCMGARYQARRSGKSILSDLLVKIKEVIILKDSNLAAPEIYRYFIRQFIDEITDPIVLRRIYTIAYLQHEKVVSGNG